MREEPLRLARRAEVEAVDVLDTGGAKRTLGRGPQIQLPVAHDVVAECLPEGRRDLFPDLVAARADARADRGGEPPRAESADAGRHDAGEQAAPAGVQDSERRPATLAPRDRDRHAVGGE